MIYKSVGYFLLIIAVFIGLNCQPEKPQSTSQKPKEKKDSLVNNGHTYSQMHRGITRRDTLMINKLELIRLSNDMYFEGIMNMAGDTLISGADYCNRAEFLDINHDQYQDVRIHVYSNTPNQCENYFFDPQTKIFRKIEGEDLNFKKLKGTEFYYSNNRGSCMGSNWEGHLTRIENWTQITVGEIDINGCGDKDDGIYIYKIDGEKRTIIKRLPIIDFTDYIPFLEKYWKKNYRLFEK
ncbi:hypothetical protein [Emticicia fontis]